MTMIKGKAICDGRGNAGTGARAAVLYVTEEWPAGLSPNRWKPTQRYEVAEKLDSCTNIVAEHLSIQLALEHAQYYGVTHLEILNDSQTPVNQCLGIYKVEADHVKPLVERTWQMVGDYQEVVLTWVPRAQTLEADALCRKVDRPTPTKRSPFKNAP